MRRTPSIMSPLYHVFSRTDASVSGADADPDCCNLTRADRYDRGREDSMAQNRLVTELWSRTIDAQLDLARMAARSRQLTLAIVGVALIVAAVLGGTASHVNVALGG